MPNKTPNYQLTQPLVTEAYDVNQFNENASIIDTELKSLSDKIDGKGGVQTVNGIGPDEHGNVPILKIDGGVFPAN